MQAKDHAKPKRTGKGGTQTCVYLHASAETNDAALLHDVNTTTALFCCKASGAARLLLLTYSVFVLMPVLVTLIAHCRIGTSISNSTHRLSKQHYPEMPKICAKKGNYNLGLGLSAATTVATAVFTASEILLRSLGDCLPRKHVSKALKPLVDTVPGEATLLPGGRS